MLTRTRLWLHRNWRRLAVELLVITLVIVGVRAYTTRGTASGPAPPIEAQAVDGTPVSLAALRGQPVMVHFWATWCPICRTEQGSVEAIARGHRVVTVAMQSGDAAAVRRYLREQDWQVSAVADEDGALSRAFGVRAVPATFFVDARGQVRFVEAGYTTGIGMRLRLWLAGRG
jgi:peroxiredoxin